MDLGEAPIIKQKQKVVSSPAPSKCRGSMTVQYMSGMSLAQQFVFKPSALCRAFDRTPVTIPIVCHSHQFKISKSVMSAQGSLAEGRELFMKRSKAAIALSGPQRTDPNDR